MAHTFENPALAQLAQAEQALADRQHVAAREAFNRAQASGADPNRCGGGRWLAAMLNGDFEAAWRESDALRQRNAPDPHRLWNGEDLHGARVIVRCLHGLGDSVQMMRYAPLLRRIASHLTFEVPPRLQELASSFTGVDNVITWGEAAPAVSPEWDVQVEIMQLPYLFRTHCADLPLATKYLHLSSHSSLNTSQLMSRAVQSNHDSRRRPRVGVVWAASEWNQARSLPVHLLASLLANPAIEFWNLQGGEAAALDHALGMHSADALCGQGLLSLATTIANLDLVLTVDTLAAHLAGALGCPAWVLLEHAADWRWLSAPLQTSPWYPTLQLFRQPTAGDWQSVVRTIVHKLDSFAPALA